jgi:hypothetical protein
MINSVQSRLAVAALIMRHVGLAVSGRFRPINQSVLPESFDDVRHLAHLCSVKRKSYALPF